MSADELEERVSRKDYDDLYKRVQLLEPGTEKCEMLKFVRERVPNHLLEIKDRKTEIRAILRPVPTFIGWPEKIQDQKGQIAGKLRGQNKKFVMA